ncbi:clavaminic acid synthetase [Burkholderia glumae]|uniref:TauD/TfdA family dioxygenase n=1 Tax=Burkholderia glumae TaxID=337 RepID=UPI0003A1E3F6|nr:TauD/TfdA family dioxygenase [Burkholderia glumae]MCM2494922.1 TauD/TfdA family dioxygenase [Burkholderia glumae]MCM2545787.1 TauD/TfdA family dioxygenase [Burkholderia glumae]MCQ0030901.1 TauD/TfdA family dioxygenase [Burkholderia glumae]MCQ0036144.1 TauD/TfdA family dioxygenase [Burkholderia glumae]QJW81559.1 clavaminic acid synthetase [Burkholderia glumae]
MIDSEVRRRTHRRPPAWSSPAALELPGEIADAVETLLQAIARDTDAELDGYMLDSVRDRIHAQLEFGSGAIKHESAVLAGLGQADFQRVFGQFCRYLGQPVAINKAGDVIKEVKDAGHRDSTLAPARGHMTNQELAFHSDRADVTVLACWEPATSGGEFKVCSSARLIELIERHDPAWRAWLTRPIPHDLRDEGGSPDQGYCLLPILTETRETFVLRYIRKFNESVKRHGIELPDEARAMLDGIDALLEDDSISVEFPFAKGTLVLTNNHTTLHSRNAFVDVAPQQRCLLRCWIASEYTRPLPAEFVPVFHHVEAGVLRGGIATDTSGTRLQALSAAGH